MEFEREPAGPSPLPHFLLAAAAALPTAWAWAGVAAALAATVQADALLVFPVLALLVAPAALALAYARVSRVAVVWAAEATLFVGLPLWGLALDAVSPLCDHGCEDTYQPVAWPGILWVYLAYGLGLAGWVAHRLRPEPLPALAESLVDAALLAGIVATGSLALQFGLLPIYGLLFAPLGMPLVAPWACGLAFGWALARRAPHRSAALASAILATAGWLGLDLVAHRVLFGGFGLWGGAFAKTCGWTLSTLEAPVEDCHYLCTVAAQGHPWLVRPLRTGRRRGHAIVVNRQLAVANAFEDLLHERWPRFGRWARRTYDALAFPVSGWLLNPWAADLVFLAMLPAQAGFELFLRLVDRRPEDRIDRMYR
jgi:hypothetical protein